MKEKGSIYMNPTNKQQLFIVTGASGVGKSAACEVLFQKEQDYIVLESDILWDSRFDGDPDGGYREFRELWMTMCANISQIGKPCVLCGCAEPRHFELRDARHYFADIHYLSVVCREEVMRYRMKELRGINDENWINGSVFFNNWLIENADKTEPHMTLVDNSDLSITECAEKIHEWIAERMR
jgi:hypothetical protein